MNADTREPGTLVLVVGNSGVGKDTIIGGARMSLANDARFVFPRRYITRPIDASEDHISLTQAKFAELQTRGSFALHWTAHDLHYGVPASIDQDLAAQKVVVCNVSRLAVQPARDAYLRTAVIEIKAPVELRATRLAARNRESAADVSARLSRDIKATTQPDFVLENDGMPTGAIQAFVRMLLAIPD